MLYFLRSFAPKKLPLSSYEKRITFPNGIVEEGLIEEIFKRIKPLNKCCVEFGAGDGINFSFTRNLIQNHGWNALLIEADDRLSRVLVDYYANNKKVQAVSSMLTTENIENIFKEANIPSAPDFMLVDIDGNDYHLWKAITAYLPNVVMIEYNPSYGSDQEFVVPYDPSYMWNGDDHYGASFRSMVNLGVSKGYVLIHCSSGGDNLVFAKKEFSKLFTLPKDISDFYQIPQYGKNGRVFNGKGHPVSKQNSSFLFRLFCIARYRLVKPLRVISKLFY